jgi:hypothetical protein
MESPYIDELSASFFVMGSSAAPSEITKNLGIKPHYYTTKGDPRLKKYGHEVETHTENLWGFNSHSFIDESRIDAHLSYILNVVEPHATYLSNLPEPARLFVEISCSLKQPYLSTSFVIENNLLSRLNNLNISIGFVFRVIKYVPS